METIYTTPLGPSFGGNGYTRRHVIAASSLLSTATSVRVAFQHLATAYTITEAYIGLKSTSGDAYDIDPATMVRLTQDGNNTLSITKTKYYSDEVPFTISGNSAIIISLYGATSQVYLSGTFPAGYTAYHRLGNYAGVADATSFSTSTSNVYGFLAIEGTRTQLSGTISVDEEVDDVAILSHTWNVGNVEITESIDDVSCQGVSYVCFANINEAIDDVSASGWSAVAGISFIQEELDTIVASAYSPNVGQVSVFEDLDEISGFACETGSAIQGTITTEEYVDRVSLVGVNQANRVSVVEDVDDLSVAASTWNVGIVKVREYLDVVSAQMVRGESRGAVSITEAVDHVSAVGTTSNVGKVSITCGLDDVGVVAATEQLNVGVVSFAEPVDVISSQAIVCIGATADITEDIDGINGVLASCNHGTVSIHEELDVVKLSTKIIMPSLGFSRPLSGMSGGTPPPHLGVLHFDRGSIAVTSAAQPIKIEPIHFAR